MSDDDWQEPKKRRRGKPIETELADLLNAEPFRPFEIGMTNGQNFIVQTAFHLQIGPVFLDLVLPEAGSVRLRLSEICLLRFYD